MNYGIVFQSLIYLSRICSTAGITRRCQLNSAARTRLQSARWQYARYGHSYSAKEEPSRCHSTLIMIWLHPSDSTGGVGCYHELHKSNLEAELADQGGPCKYRSVQRGRQVSLGEIVIVVVSLVFHGRDAGVPCGGRFHGPASVARGGRRSEGWQTLIWADAVRGDQRRPPTGKPGRVLV